MPEQDRKKSGDTQPAKQLTVGTLVRHATFGQGKVIGIKTGIESTSYEILFKGSGSKTMSDKVSQNLVILSPESLEAQIFEHEDMVRQMLVKQPSELAILVLKDRNGMATATEIRKALLPLFPSDAEARNWWKKVQPAFRSHPLVDSTGANRYVLRNKPASKDEKMLAGFDPSRVGSIDGKSGQWVLDQENYRRACELLRYQKEKRLPPAGLAAASTYLQSLLTSSNAPTARKMELVYLFSETGLVEEQERRIQMSALVGEGLKLYQLPSEAMRLQALKDLFALTIKPEKWQEVVASAAGVSAALAESAWRLMVDNKLTTGFARLLEFAICENLPLPTDKEGRYAAYAQRLAWAESKLRAPEVETEHTGPSLSISFLESIRQIMASCRDRALLDSMQRQAVSLAVAMSEADISGLKHLLALLRDRKLPADLRTSLLATLGEVDAGKQNLVLRDLVSAFQTADSPVFEALFSGTMFGRETPDKLACLLEMARHGDSLEFARWVVTKATTSLRDLPVEQAIRLLPALKGLADASPSAAARLEKATRSLYDTVVYLAFTGQEPAARLREAIGLVAESITSLGSQVVQEHEREVESLRQQIEAARQEVSHLRSEYQRVEATLAEVRHAYDEARYEASIQEKIRVLSHMADLADEIQEAQDRDPSAVGVLEPLAQHVSMILAENSVSPACFRGQSLNFDPHLHHYVGYEAASSDLVTILRPAWVLTRPDGTQRVVRQAVVDA